jgi:hypothetical protein
MDADCLTESARESKSSRKPPAAATDAMPWLSIVADGIVLTAAGGKGGCRERE